MVAAIGPGRGIGPATDALWRSWRVPLHPATSHGALVRATPTRTRWCTNG